MVRPRAAARKAGLEDVEKVLTNSIVAANKTSWARVKWARYGHAMALEQWAKSQAEDLMAPLGDRWLHVQAVASQARRVGLVLVDEDRDVLVAAAYLHDIGYAPSLNQLGFHPDFELRNLVNGSFRVEHVSSINFFWKVMRLKADGIETAPR